MHGASRVIWACAALLAVGSVRASAGGGGFLHRLADEVRAQVVAAVHARPARPVPPEPVAVHWNAQWIGSLDLGVGTPLAFGPSEHQASHLVWGTVMDPKGGLQLVSLE